MWSYFGNSIPGVPIENHRFKGECLLWSHNLQLSSQKLYCNFHRKGRLGRNAPDIPPESGALLERNFFPVTRKKNFEVSFPF